MHTFNQSNLSMVQIWTRHCSLQIEGHLKVVSSEKRKSFAKNFALFCISFARQKSKKFRFFQKREIVKRNNLLWYKKLLKLSSQSKEFNKFFREISLRFRIYWLNFSKYESFLFAWKLQILYLCYTYTACSDKYRNGLNWRKFK